MVVLVVRGSVGGTYRSAYSDDWDRFKRGNPAYRQVVARLGGEKAQLVFSARTGFWVFRCPSAGWESLFEQEFLPGVKPLFYHRVHPRRIKEADVLPFYLALIYFTRSAGGVSNEDELAALLGEEFYVEQPTRVLGILIRLGFVRRFRRRLRVAPVSWLCPPYIDKSTSESIRGYAGEKSEQRQMPLSVPGLHVSYLQHVYSLLAEGARSYSDLERREDSEKYRLDWTQDVFPLVHRMLDYYLYDEASHLLDACRKALAPVELSEEETTRVRGEFDVLRKSSWGFLFREACPGGNWQRAAAILPLTIPYIEDGVFQPLSPNGPYRFLPNAPSPVRSPER